MQLYLHTRRNLKDRARAHEADASRASVQTAGQGRDSAHYEYPDLGRMYMYWYGAAKILSAAYCMLCRAVARAFLLEDGALYGVCMAIFTIVKGY